MSAAAGAPKAKGTGRGGMAILDRIRHAAITRGLPARIASVILALVLAIPLFRIAGVSPWSAYKAIWDGAAGSQVNIGFSLARIDLYILLALGIAASFRARVYNIGAEGQLYIGAMATTAVAVHLSAPSAVLLPVALLAGALGGAAWSLLAGVLYTRFKVNILISTLMLNYIAILFVGVMVVGGPLSDPQIPAQSSNIPNAGQMWHLFPGSQIYAGIAFAVGAVIVMWILSNRTTLGYELRVLGGNPRAAEHAGINEARLTLKVTAIAGALAGLAGGVLVTETVHYLSAAISDNFGYTAIAVALLGALRPGGVAAAAVLFGLLEIGATQMSYTANVPATTANMIEGMVILFFLASPLLVMLWRRIRHRGDAGPVVLSPDTLQIVDLEEAGLEDVTT
jgi:general nucleoside transport system permease protein